MPRAKIKKRLRPAKISATGVDFNESLPSIEGPQLGPFRHRNSIIEFVSLLSDESLGSYSHVFEVVIESKHYALKMFKFYDVAEYEMGLVGQDVPQDVIIVHLDPFYAECRAYGRIEENKLNGKITVYYYGFTAVSALEEVFLSETFNVSEWDRLSEEYSLPMAERQSFRTIVKDLIEDETPFNKKMVARILKDLLSLRRMTLFVRDVREDNYRGGKLVDFSVSWTALYIMLSNLLFNDEDIEEDIGWELTLFDIMIEDYKISTWVRATPNKEYIRKLRPRS